MGPKNGEQEAPTAFKSFSHSELPKYLLSQGVFQVLRILTFKLLGEKRVALLRSQLQLLTASWPFVVHIQSRFHFSVISLSLCFPSLLERIDWLPLYFFFNQWVLKTTGCGPVFS